MVSALCACILWLGIVTYFNYPVSSTHSIIGALLAFGLIETNFDFSVINWDIIVQTAISWFAAPILAAVLSNLFARFVDFLFKQTQIKKARSVFKFALLFSIVITVLTLFLFIGKCHTKTKQNMCCFCFCFNFCLSCFCKTRCDFT